MESGADAAHWIGASAGIAIPVRIRSGSGGGPAACTRARTVWSLDSGARNLGLVLACVGHAKTWATHVKT